MQFVVIAKDRKKEKIITARKSAKKLTLLGGSEPNLKTPPRRRPSKK